MSKLLTLHNPKQCFFPLTKWRVQINSSEETHFYDVCFIVFSCISRNKKIKKRRYKKITPIWNISLISTKKCWYDQNIISLQLIRFLLSLFHTNLTLKWLNLLFVSSFILWTAKFKHRPLDSLILTRCYAQNHGPTSQLITW